MYIQIKSPRNLQDFLPYQNYFTTIKWNFKKFHHQLPNSQLIELSSSSEIQNIIQEGEVNFRKNPTAGLPEVSKLINAAINKRHRDQRKHSFLEEKKKRKLDKRENGFTMNTQKYYITWWILLWSNRFINFTKDFFISQNV